MTELLPDTARSVHCGTRRTTIAALKDRAMRLASAFHAKGVRKGDVIAALFRNDLAFLEATLACDRLGVYLTAVNWHLAPAEVQHILTDCQARILIGHADLLDRLGDLGQIGPDVIRVVSHDDINAAYGLKPVGGDTYEALLAGQRPWSGPKAPSPGTISYSSGTTGRPKGIKRLPYSLEEEQRYSEARRRLFGIERGDRVAIPGPLYHSQSNSAMRLALAHANHIHVMPRFNAADLLRIIGDEAIAHLSMVPIMFARLLDLPASHREAADTSSVRFVLHGGSSCPTRVKAGMADWWGDVFFESYGSTECGLVTLSSTQDWRSRPASVGRVFNTVEVAIMSEDGTVLPEGEEGEILVRNPNYPPFEYIGLPGARAAIEKHGYLSNEDIGYLDADGYLYVTDRKRDMIISGGVNIYPSEIEAALDEIDGISESAVFGIPHPEFGEAVAAALVCNTKGALDADWVRAALKGRIAGYKIPKLIEFHDSFARDDLGKLRKRELRAPHWQNAGRRI